MIESMPDGGWVQFIAHDTIGPCDVSMIAQPLVSLPEAGEVLCIIGTIEPDESGRIMCHMDMPGDPQPDVVVTQ